MSGGCDAMVVDDEREVRCVDLADAYHHARLDHALAWARRQMNASWQQQFPALIEALGGARVLLSQTRDVRRCLERIDDSLCVTHAWADACRRALHGALSRMAACSPAAYATDRCLPIDDQVYCACAPRLSQIRRRTEHLCQVYASGVGVGVRWRFDEDPNVWFRPHDHDERHVYNANVVFGMWFTRVQAQLESLVHDTADRTTCTTTDRCYASVTDVLLDISRVFDNAIAFSRCERASPHINRANWSERYDGWARIAEEMKQYSADIFQSALHDATHSIPVHPTERMELIRLCEAVTDERVREKIADSVNKFRSPHARQPLDDTHVQIDVDALSYQCVKGVREVVKPNHG